MKLEEQVCSLELAKKLKELGFKQESLFYHLVGGIASRSECLPLMGSDWCSAFTVAELGELLPCSINNDDLTIMKSSDLHWDISYDAIANGCHEESFYDQSDLNEANARAKMLIYLIENNLMKAS